MYSFASHKSSRSKNSVFLANKKNKMVNKFLSEIPKWVSFQPELMEEHKRVWKEVVEGKNEHLDESLKETLEVFFNQWFIFDRIGKLGKTPFDLFIEKNYPLFSEEEKAVYKKFWSEMFFSIFKIISVKPGESMEIKDLVSGKTYFVKEYLGTLQATPGIILISRLFPFKDHWLLGSVIRWPEPYPIERAIRHFPESFKKKPITALNIIQTFFLKPLKDIKDLKTCEEEIKKWLRGHGIKISLQEIKTKISEEKEKAYPFFLAKIFSSNPSISTGEMQEFIDLTIKLYNFLPQKELGGLSPEEKSKEAPIGEKERMLIADFFQSVSLKINPDTYPDKNEVKKAMKKLWEEWLRTPQEELGRRTPEDVIIDERKKLGRKDLKISYTMEICKFREPSEEKIEINKEWKRAGELLSKNKPGEALKIYENLFPLIKDSPESFRIYGNLGLCYALTENKEKGIEYLKKALELNPNYKVARKNLKKLL